MAPFQALHWKNVALHVGVGMGAASFWRGAWYVLDDHLFPDQPGYSALASLGLGTIGMATSQGLMHRCEQMAAKILQQQQQQQTTPSVSSLLQSSHHQHHHWRQLFLLRMARFGAVYTVALSVVLVWRGTWVGWDVLYEHFHNRNHPSLTSSTTTTSTAAFFSSQSSSSSESESHLTTTTPPIHQHSVSMVKSTDPGHLTYSGIASHVAAVSILLGAGLFASVLAPPAAVSIIRDTAVHAAKSSTSNVPRASSSLLSVASSSEYQGPAAKMLSDFLSSGSSLRSSSSSPTLSLSATGAMRSTKPLFMTAAPTNSGTHTIFPNSPPSGHLTETMKHRSRMCSTTTFPTITTRWSLTQTAPVTLSNPTTLSTPTTTTFGSKY